MAYVIIADIRAEGVEADTASDGKITGLITLCSQLVERVTRQFFEPRTLTVRLDGDGSNTLHLPLPVISVTSLKINNATYAAEPASYRVYNGRSPPTDDRKNPKIVLIDNSDGSIFTRTFHDGGGRFAAGNQNQEVIGSFGYTESDGSTPAAIKRAVTKMVIERITNPPYTSPGDITATAPTVAGVIIEEETDGHRVKYGANTTSPASARRAGIVGISQDPEVQDILKMYRAPMAVYTSSVFRRIM